MEIQGAARTDKKPPIWLYFTSRFFDVIDLLVRYGTIPLFFWLCVREVAGHETVVNVFINYFAKGGNLMPWGLAGGASIWAYGERKFRQVKTQRWSQHNMEMEKRLDPNRTSSCLTSSGQTPKH